MKINIDPKMSYDDYRKFISDLQYTKKIYNDWLRKRKTAWKEYQESNEEVKIYRQKLLEMIPESPI